MRTSAQSVTTFDGSFQHIPQDTHSQYTRPKNKWRKNRRAPSYLVGRAVGEERKREKKHHHEGKCRSGRRPSPKSARSALSFSRAITCKKQITFHNTTNPTNKRGHAECGKFAKHRIHSLECLTTRETRSRQRKKSGEKTNCACTKNTSDRIWGQTIVVDYSQSSNQSIGKEIDKPI